MDSMKIKIFRDCGLSEAYFVMNSVATIVACYGLLANNAAVIIGAMLLAMLLGPINGLGYSLAHGQLAIFRKSILSEIVGILIVVSISALIGYIHNDIAISNEMLARTNPNIFDLMIALVGGAGSAYALTSSRLAAAMGGVAIATALVPPLATCGMLITRNVPTEALGAFMLFTTNLLAISFSGMLVFYFTAKDVHGDEGNSLRALWIMRAITALLLFFISIYLWKNLSELVENQVIRASVAEVIKAEFERDQESFLNRIWIETGESGPEVFIIVRSTSIPSVEKVKRIDKKLEALTGRKLRVHVRHVPVEEIVSD